MDTLQLVLGILQLLALVALGIVWHLSRREEVDLERSLRAEGSAARSEAAQHARTQREELAGQLQRTTVAMEKRLETVRSTVEAQLKLLQEGNEKKLEQMRKTVDEQLQGTLEKRLGESFKLVSERLEAVQQGLGKMQSLAADVGGLKQALTNVKTRGVFGEVQLGALIEDMLSPEQYETNKITIPGSNDRVEYAIRLPGTDADTPVWLPIDAKFPIEDYQRLLQAQDQADKEAASSAGAALERRVRDEAKRIRSKYVEPPHTTEFGILFLPTEGLYAEVLRRPGLLESIQSQHRITLAGPTTLTALLNSLQMGFRTLAIEKSSSEVWKMLAAVKTEFGRFGEVLDKVKKQVGTVSKTLESTDTRFRQMDSKLKAVESLGRDNSSQLLGLPAEEINDED